MVRVCWGATILLWMASWAASTVAAPADPKALPGRQVKVAAIAIGFGGDRDAKLKLALAHLETAGAVPRHARP